MRAGRPKRRAGERRFARRLQRAERRHSGCRIASTEAQGVPARVDLSADRRGDLAKQAWRRASGSRVLCRPAAGWVSWGHGRQASREALARPARRFGEARAGSRGRTARRARRLLRGRAGQGRRRGSVFTLYILRKAQGGGLGAELLGTMARVLRANGARSLHLWVLASNIRAQAFYQHLGGARDQSRSVAGWGGGLMETRYVWPAIDDLADRS